MFTVKRIALLITLLALNNVLIITDFTPSVVYVGVFSLIVVVSFFKASSRFEPLLLCFVLTCMASIFVNQIPAYFKSNERFLMFVVVLLIISPLINNEFLFRLKLYSFKYSNICIIVLTMVSFLGRLTGFYSGADSAGNYGGLTINSMTLSPLAGISFIISLYMVKVKSLSKKWSIFYKMSLMISFLTLILSASRIALASTIIGTLFFLSKVYKDRLGKLIRVMFASSLILLASYPLWSTYTADIVEKTEERGKEGNQFSSREALWAFRIKEFNESPILGIGYANAMFGEIDYDTGTIEPGTSWGVVLAMTGIVGITLFVIIALRAYIKNLRVCNMGLKANTYFLNTLLIFFFIHWIAEGYMLAAGSYLFFYAWLLLGVCDVHSKSYNIDVV
ncbi:MAG: O-antigen ligase family protein [Psychroserpens sp.]|uniref:O-antigen ligase family protein n=1 Tax=Psychroserpens sp. TaxID=2020870 RepID=UPI003C9BC8C8